MWSQRATHEFLQRLKPAALLLLVLLLLLELASAEVGRGKRIVVLILLLSVFAVVLRKLLNKRKERCLREAS